MTLPSRKPAVSVARNRRPALAVTLGDPCGIGPEITAALIAELAPRGELDRAVFVGPPDVLAAAIAPQGLSGLATSDDLRRLEDPTVVTVAPISVSGPFPPGAIGAAGGAAAVAAVEEAHRLCRTGVCAGMVTAPIGKKAIREAGSMYSGHTDMLGALTGSTETRMAMVHRRFRVVMTTLHMSYREVLARLTISSVVRTLELAHAAWATPRRPFPTIGVGGLNPHAGEDGLFGTEEEEIITPALARFRARNPHLVGPLPCDSLFTPKNRRRFDVFVVHTHDQGLIAIKALVPMTCVNVTLGLPYIRTSVGHGTAYDLAGQGRADPAGMVAAWREAVRLAQGLGRG